MNNVARYSDDDATRRKVGEEGIRTINVANLPEDVRALAEDTRTES